MTNKEIAERLRKMSVSIAGRDMPMAIEAFADELDPSGPDPGTIVWWQDTEGLSDPVLGQVNEYGFIEMFGTGKALDRWEIKWWPARIAGARDALEGADDEQ